MAEEPLQKLEEQLSCSVCLDTYIDPKLLQCFHVYCRTCLVRLVVRDQQGQLTLTCPTCRQITPVPANGVAGLQSAFHINNLLEIRESLKKIQKTSATQEGSVGSAINPKPEKKVSYCSVHEDKELELYCETCGELICTHCAIKGGKHHSHDYELLNEAFERYKEEIAPSLEPMEKQLTTINKALAQLNTCSGEISDRRAAIEDDIHNTIERLHEVLDVRKTSLISQLHQITQDKLKDLAAQRDQIETTQAQLSSCLGFMKEILTTNSQGEVLKMKAVITKKVKNLRTPFQPASLTPNTKADMIFSAPADMTAVCQNYGQVAVSSLLDPSKCHATGKGLDIAVVGEKSTANLQAIDLNGHPYEEPIKSWECELVTKTTARASVMKRGQSQYEISYLPTIKGKHQLHIKVEGHHIRGSPFSIAVRSPVEKLSTPSLTLASVEEPWTVALNKGEVVVTEYSGHCVSIFSPSGEKLLSFGKRGSNDGEFKHPRGVAVDGEGNILVTDSRNHRIQKFTADGQFLKAVGTEGSGPLQFFLPKGIAVNAINKKLYIGDVLNHRIQVLNPDFTFSSTFGKKGSDKGQFDSPCGIAFDSTGKVYVADSDNHRIQVFTAKGKFLRMFGRCGEGRGELNWPVDIAVDTSDLVHVIECKNHRISTFTSKGQFVMSFGREGEEPGEFNNPRGLAVDDSGAIYVCDSYNNRVQVFK